MIAINSHTEKLIDLIGLLHRAPRTRPELIELTQMSEGAVQRWVTALSDEGLIRPIGTRPSGRRASVVFGWVPRAAQEAT